MKKLILYPQININMQENGCVGVITSDLLQEFAEFMW